MKYKLLVLLCAPYSLFGSFLTRDTDDNKLTPSEIHKLKASQIEQDGKISKQFFFLSESTIFPPLCWAYIWGFGSYNPLNDLPQNLISLSGIAMSKRVTSVNDPATARDHRFEAFPVMSFIAHYPILEYTYQKIYYRHPKETSSSYYGLGLGISSCQGVPFFFTIGKEWDRFSKHGSILEFQMSAPFFILPLFNAKLSYGKCF